MERAPKYADLHTLVIEAQLMNDGGVQIATIMPVYDGIVADFVRLAVRHSTLDAAARQPH